MLHALRCEQGHESEIYVHVAADLGCETRLCACGGTLAPVLSVGRGLTYFGEGGGGRWIHNLSDQPQFITSPAQHAKAMKDAGVTWATGWKHKGTGGWA